ncbi:MAG: hypothetical protein AAB263_19075 [Planctomycetota bacterium]
MLRSVVLLTLGAWFCAGVVAAADPVVPPLPTSVPIEMHFTATGNTRLGLRPGQPAESSGVTFLYERVRLACDFLAYRSESYQGAVSPVLVEAKLLGGPLGPADGRVLIDTSQSQLTQMAFKGELHPKTVILRRQEPLEARPNIVRFQLEAADVGDFSGLVNTAAGERQYVIWADHIIMDLEAPLAPAAKMGIETPRLRAMHMYGRPAQDGQPARGGIILRMLVGTVIPKEQANAERLRGLKTYGACNQSMTQSLYFDEQGNMVDYVSSYMDVDRRDGEDMVPQAQPKPTSQPKIAP